MDMIALGAVVYAVVNFLKHLANKDGNAVVTQLITWLGGMVVVLVASAADISASIELFGAALGDMDVASKILVGLQTSSLFMVVYDVKSAIDGNDSARTPPLTGTPTAR